ncbi:hypothetical protein AKJ09_07784 [Labilithrix luteola]|uniref:IgGFc-binding protein N-terminal domain-containing protein n=1 Tax=Labilithrix luteola TaxID=1391654 RepID=A0A0K1Q5L8_9BACT|nr:hypothetical protein AKJ09_07784 [Labilithrix luteola]
MVLFGLALGFAACSSNKDGFSQDAPQLVDVDAGADVSSPPPAACEGRRCSRDLHSVIDGCTGQVLETCADDQGCASARCVTACDSAAASQGSIGCSFWSTPPDVSTFGQNSCFAAFIANTWNTPVTVTAEYGSDPLDVSNSVYKATTGADGATTYTRIEGAIPPGEVGIVFLQQGDPLPRDQHFVACPKGVNVAWHGIPIPEHQTSIYKAFHLSTNLPVSAYSMFPYGGAKSYIPSATLLVPSTSWDTNYFLVDGWKSNEGMPFVQIIAQEDNTEVRMKPSVALKEGKGVAPAPAGFTASWTINRGEVLEFAQGSSLAGSPIQTSHPVALFGGSQCSYVPSNIGACDSLHQQIAPLRQWASTYSAVPYRSRIVGLQGTPLIEEAVYWKMVAARDGTTLTYEPAPPPDAPTTLNAGESVTFTSAAPFVVKSQGNDYPFYVAVYMSGGDVYSTPGDPDFVNIVPDEQFLDHYVFFVDHTFSESVLTLVRRKDESGAFHDVSLDCAGTIAGWQPLGKDGTIEYTWVALTHNGQGVTTPAGTCSYGRHEAKSDGAFMVYVWGEDTYASYGFPAGAGSRPTSPYTVEIR